ncbi:hypothetical protein [Acidocella sp.]|uniref:hypothetical protein n=1 Tax=Acidocella sp. TaxID=50710 RepID=UPI002624933C|nr:hypothetical protein [Acidocella sp.]
MLGFEPLTDEAALRALLAEYVGLTTRALYQGASVSSVRGVGSRGARRPRGVMRPRVR